MTTRDLGRALTELREAQPSYLEAEQQYEGNPKEWFGSERLKKALERTGTHWRLPFARIVVNAVRDRMELSSVSSATPEVDRFLADRWAANRMDQESGDVHQWFLVYGESYALLWPDEEEEVQVYYTSPRVMRLFYDEETGRRKRFAGKVWIGADGHTRATLYYPDRIEKWRSKTEAPKTEKDFAPYYDLEAEDPETGDRVNVWPIPNEYGFVPVYHFRTERPHGRPEHVDAYSPQQMINKLVINLMATNDFQGFPQRWAIADAASEETNEFDADDLEWLEAGGAGAPKDVDAQAPKLKSGPGELWWLQGITSVGEFTPASVDSFLSPLRFLLESLGSLTSTPTDFFLSAEGAAPSGESRRVAHAPLTKKVADRQTNAGATWEELWSEAAMMGLGLTERPVVTLTWKPIESYDDTASWEAASLKQANGVPKKRTLVEQGYSQTEVDTWYPEEEADETGVDAMKDRVALLGSLAEAAQKLGMSVQFGVMTEAQAQETMAQFLVAANEEAAS